MKPDNFGKPIAGPQTTPGANRPQQTGQATPKANTDWHGKDKRQNTLKPDATLNKPTTGQTGGTYSGKGGK